MTLIVAFGLGALGPSALFMASTRLKPALTVLLCLVAVPLYCVGVMPFVAPGDGGWLPLCAMLAGIVCGSCLAWRVLRK